MSFKFSLVPLAAIAVLASPLVASADTITAQNTGNPERTRTERVIIEKRPVERRAEREVNERVVPNYIGVGGSNRGAALNAKISLTNRISFRALAIDNFQSDDEQEGNFAFPITYDFQPVIGKLQPYAGAGVGINTEGSDDVGPMLTAGLDYPISKNLTLNGSVNFDAYGNNDVNGILGIATNIQRR